MLRRLCVETSSGRRRSPRRRARRCAGARRGTSRAICRALLRIVEVGAQLRAVGRDQHAAVVLDVVAEQADVAELVEVGERHAAHAAVVSAVERALADLLVDVSLVEQPLQLARSDRRGASACRCDTDRESRRRASRCSRTGRARTAPCRLRFRSGGDGAPAAPNGFDALRDRSPAADAAAAGRRRCRRRARRCRAAACRRRGPAC